FSPAARSATRTPSQPQTLPGSPWCSAACAISGTDRSSLRHRTDRGDDRGVLGRDVVAKGDNAVVGGAAGLVGVDLGRDRLAVQRAQGIAPRLRLVGRVRLGERF